MIRYKCVNESPGTGAGGGGSIRGGSARKGYSFQPGGI